MKRRLLIIALALIPAAIGTAGVIAYVRGANARAIEGVKAVSVLVAQKKVASGTSASSALRHGLIASEKLPASSVPANALHSVPAGLSTLVLSSALQPGQLLLRPMLITPVHVTGGLAIPPHMLAVTANFCLPEAVAGDVQAGSEVAVFDTVVMSGTGQASAGPACTGPHAQQGVGGVKTRLVLAHAQVLSVGAYAGGQPGSTSVTTANTGSASGQGTMMVTLALSQAQAEKLIQITETGLPYLALITTSSQTSADIGRLLNIRPHPVAPPSPPPPPSPSPTPSAAPSPAPSAAAEPSPPPTPRKGR
jgi:pilus assembly protein CpaB